MTAPSVMSVLLNIAFPMSSTMNYFEYLINIQKL